MLPLPTHLPTLSLHDALPISPQAGLLIYTAAGDSEGTLGGLVRQGEAPLLARTLMSTLERSDWCSSDPLCRESRGQGLDSLNLRSEEHTSELQSQSNLVCRLL